MKSIFTNIDFIIHLSAKFFYILIMQTLVFTQCYIINIDFIIYNLPKK